MLKTLHIENYALIEKVHIDFKEGFTVITGETGAGKSILLGALGLLTGKRADISSIGNAAAKCVIEGTFAIDTYALNGFFESHDLDYDAHTIIRRELLPSGKSRAFINDTPVTVQQLATLGTVLVDIHSQHSTRDVLHTVYQFDILDTFADNTSLLQSYSETYREYQHTIKAYNALLEQRSKMKQESDYNLFLFNELQALEIKPDEYETIEEQHKLLSYGEEITSNLSKAYQAINQDDTGVLDVLGAIRQDLTKIQDYGTNFKDFFDRIDSVYIELQDIAASIGDAATTSEYDPNTLEQLNERLSALYNLLQKHQVSTTTELLAIQETLDHKLQHIDTIDDQVAQEEHKIAQLKAVLEKEAAKLHAKRKQAIPQLINTLEERVKELHIDYAKFDIKLSETTALTERGIDTVEFLFSANKGQDVKPLNKGASGGELSRVMLAIKGILSEHSALPTLIFDEIDTGVSGTIAATMGAVLKRMSTAMQLLCITHLPQIAGQGTSHFKVIKRVDKDTHTEIIPLDTDGRVEEIAQMLGGLESGEAVLEHAKSLIKA